MPPKTDQKHLNLPKVTREVEDNLYHAQELAFKAWEEPDIVKRLELAQKALEISPYCIDGYNIMASMADTDEERLEIYQRAEEVGRKYLGKKFFRENKGIFWGVLETRPYMRARHGIAMIYWKQRKWRKAINEFQEMLELCEGDNIGVRYFLFPLLIVEREFEKAEKLAEKYDTNIEANWLYARALLEFAKNGANDNADKLLSKALKANKETAKYLALKKKMPKDMPLSYSFGSKEEAVVAAYCQLEAWKAIENACEWIASKISTKSAKK